MRMLGSVHTGTGERLTPQWAADSKPVLGADIEEFYHRATAVACPPLEGCVPIVR